MEEGEGSWSFQCELGSNFLKRPTFSLIGCLLFNAFLLWVGSFELCYLDLVQHYVILDAFVVLLLVLVLV